MNTPEYSCTAASSCPLGAVAVSSVALRWTMRQRGLMLVASAIFLALIGVIYTKVPQGFIPRQDTGVIFGNLRAPEGVTFAELEQRQRRSAEIVRTHPDVEAVMSTAGQGFGGQVVLL